MGGIKLTPADMAFSACIRERARLKRDSGDVWDE